MRSSLDSQDAEFWELEDYPKKRFLSDEEEYCEKYFEILFVGMRKISNQVLINEEQCNCQNFVWPSKPESDIRVYVLENITYGLASSAFLAIRSLQEISYRHKNEFPQIANVILHDFYVDDLLTGADTIEEIIYLRENITKLLLSYGFPLRKWI
ncbi:hypothetical protein JTB14_008950 [Gonioctena quinquepunctata]|nr:hypothetical protein JTB14_008950 [Gonioctena quinquepunctata]